MCWQMRRPGQLVEPRGCGRPGERGTERQRKGGEEGGAGRETESGEERVCRDGAAVQGAWIQGPILNSSVYTLLLWLLRNTGGERHKKQKAKLVESMSKEEDNKHRLSPIQPPELKQACGPCPAATLTGSIKSQILQDRHRLPSDLTRP
ncbi:unnamed protein product [Pleuronectes platessa]|uniref:Uncharacterized protein n=1 Tax=Pleuronectes platessa TaxID=8262 RepID=A0A9N7UVF1_PLEPL|nr:unnamed protein product [Pleuronectes platessa]